MVKKNVCDTSMKPLEQVPITIIIQLTKDLSSHKYSYWDILLIFPTVIIVFYLKYVQIKTLNIFLIMKILSLRNFDDHFHFGPQQNESSFLQ